MWVELARVDGIAKQLKKELEEAHETNRLLYDAIGK